MKIMNSDIRSKIVRSGLKYWEVANKIGISASTLSVWMRFELQEDKREKIMDAIDSLIASKESLINQ